MSRLFTLSVLFLVLVSGVAVAQDDRDVYKITPYKIGEIKNFSITRSAARVGLDSPETCETFVLTPKFGRFFFRHAKATSEHYFIHDADYSSCGAEGKIQFVNGDAGDWTIRRYGTALLQLTAGNLKGRTIYLYCKRCEGWGN